MRILDDIYIILLLELKVNLIIFYLILY